MLPSVHTAGWPGSGQAVACFRGGPGALPAALSAAGSRAAMPALLAPPSPPTCPRTNRLPHPQMCEDLEDEEGLHTLFHIFKQSECLLLFFFLHSVLHVASIGLGLGPGYIRCSTPWSASSACTCMRHLALCTRSRSICTRACHARP